MGKKISLFLALFLLAAGISYALEAETYYADFNIIGNKAVVNIDMTFKENSTGAFTFQLPDDYDGLSVYVDDEPVTVKTSDKIRLELGENSRISLSYVTANFIDKTNFLMNMELDFDVDNLYIKLVLPEGASLKKPIKQGDLTSGSIYPMPSELTTDGRSLIFRWVRQDLEQGDELAIFAQIEPKPGYAGWIISLVLVLFISAALLYISRKKIKKEIIIEKEDMVEKHLKEDEEQIINVLKQKEGSCEQGTLRVVTGFSKATLSRILKELEERKVIYKEKRGKKNLVFLKK